jgi:mono/diheme cytochrome c family protein
MCLRALRNFAIFAVFLLPVSGNAQEPGDAQAGLSFAQKNCTACHAVRQGETESPNPEAPSFDSVAKTRGMTGRALAVWLQTSHPTMPNFLIAQKDRDNIISYIMSLKPVPAQ